MAGRTACCARRTACGVWRWYTGPRLPADGNAATAEADLGNYPLLQLFQEPLPEDRSKQEFKGIA
jgi:hypothetical protein